MGLSILALMLGANILMKPPPLPPQYEYWSRAECNVVLIVVESLRAEHLGAYGYPKDVSPTIDELARGGIVFEKAYAPAPSTRESVSALFTGMMPSQSGAIGPRAVPMMPAVGTFFQSEGVATGLFCEGDTIKDPAFTGGFDEVEMLGVGDNSLASPSKISERAVRFALEHADEQFMMYLHYRGPLYGMSGPEQQVPGHDDQEVLRLDRAIRYLLDGLRSLDVLDRTLVVFTAAHGKKFPARSIAEAEPGVYEESIRVPLIFYAPSGFGPRRMGRLPVSTVRMLPTLLLFPDVGPKDHATLPEPLFPHPASSADWPVETGLVISETYDELGGATIGIRDGHWKYIARLPARSRYEGLGLEETPQESGEFSRSSDVVDREELYNLEMDPGELRNVALEKPEIIEQMRRRIDDFRRERGQVN